jgi:hypothetical protein
MGQHLNEAKDRYEPPEIEILGSIAQLTNGGSGTSTDSCNASSFSISEVGLTSKQPG